MFIGIDIGTSAVKVVVISSEGRELASASSPLSLQTPRRNWCEQQPETWWEATLTACAELRSGKPDAWAAARAIGLSGQMHGAVMLGGELEVLRPAILWNDGRSMAQCKAMEARMPEIGSICGVPAMPGMTAPKILWMKENEPDTYSGIRHILLPKDFVRLRLTGELATDMADAAGTMWLDEANRAWSDSLCSVSATNPAWLPRLLEGPEISGQLSKEAASALGLPAGIPVAAGGGDASTGAMGIGAVHDGDAFISLGTSGQLFVCSSAFQPNAASAVHAFAHCVPGRWSVIAAMLNGASPMQWFAGVARTEIAELLKAAQSEDGRIPYFLPYLTGERTPHNDAEIRGGFLGLEPATSNAAMMHAVVDSIAYTFCDARDAIEAAGREITSPAAIGGGARSDFVLQTMSDALGIPISRYKGAETGPALGAARLGMIASGAATVAEAAVKPDVDRIFEPDLARADYHAERLDSWRKLYLALKDVRL
ncbi:MAG: xylulokinase [Nitratireductor sp.]|nr:xylulokinase [Nitratireductor sp.]